MKLTYRECFTMLTGLNVMDQVSASILDSRLSITVARNKRFLNFEVKDMQSLLKPSTDYQLFQDEKKELLKKHAEKNKDGQPSKQTIQTPQGPFDDYMIKGGTEDGSPFANDLEKLQKKHKSAIDEHEAKIKKYNDGLDLDSGFEPHMVSESFLPEKGIPQAAMNGLVYMITEEKKPSEKKKGNKK